MEGPFPGLKVWVLGSFWFGFASFGWGVHVVLSLVVVWFIWVLINFGVDPCFFLWFGFRFGVGCFALS